MKISSTLLCRTAVGIGSTYVVNLILSIFISFLLYQGGQPDHFMKAWLFVTGAFPLMLFFICLGLYACFAGFYYAFTGNPKYFG